MNVTGLCISRPVMTTLVIVAMLLFGVLGYKALPVSYLPDVEFPTLQVSANFPGASPATMAATVATPLEKEFTAIPGLISMNSTNSLGQTQITLQFSLERDIDGCAADTQAAISKASGDLPENLPEPPSYEKVNPADDPVMYIGVTSETMPLYELNDYATTFLSDAISMVQGVAQVIIYGESKLSVRVRMDPEALAARGISLEDIRSAVAAGNVNEPVGTLDGRTRSLTIESHGQLMRAEDYLDLVVKEMNGRMVRLRDLGVVVNSIQHDKAGAWLDGQRSLTVAVKKQPGANTIATVEAITRLLPTIREQLPAGINMTTIFDRAHIIQDSVNDVQFTLLLAIGLVVVVVFLFLKNISATLIASVAIPVSLVFTFAVMYVLGYSIDVLSLLALTLSVGFVVDDAIVMIENVVRHQEGGKKPYAAALDGSRQIAFTILSMTLSLAVVFVPLMFMAGIVGRVLHEFAWTITVAILCSGFVSLSLTPMLCSRFLRPGSRLGQSGFFFRGVTRFYRWSLSAAMRARWLTMLAAAAILYATIHYFVVIPKGFLPTDDLGYVIGFAESVQGISYPAMRDHLRELEPVVGGDPTVAHFIAIVGNPLQNQGLAIGILKPAHERDESGEQIARRLMVSANQFPGMNVFFTNPPMIRLTTKQTKNLYQYTIQAPDTATLFAFGTSFQNDLRTLPMLTGVTSDLYLANPELHVTLDRDKASAYGLTADAVESHLNSAYSERKVSTIYGDTDQYWVILEVEPFNKRDARDLARLYVENAGGKLVRLDAVAEFAVKTGPLQVNHTGQLPSVTFTFNIAEGSSVSDAVTAIRALAAEKLPPTITSFFEGTAQAFEESMGSVYFLLLIAIAVIYIILGILYESFIHPVTIISGLPSAAIGGLITLTLFGRDLDLFGVVGVIMLIGIVKKNAIMVVDFALEAEKRGLPAKEAAVEGALERFRPIMMTTIAAIAGAMPIALGIGAGAQARQPMGLAVVGGLIISQVVTLYLTPVVYTYMDSFQRFMRRRGEKKRALMGMDDAA